MKKKILFSILWLLVFSCLYEYANTMSNIQLCFNNPVIPVAPSLPLKPTSRQPWEDSEIQNVYVGKQTPTRFQRLKRRVGGGFGRLGKKTMKNKNQIPQAPIAPSRNFDY